MGKKEEFISLKEAAEISGYAPDYIGQLIREGKLTGKQVYSNVSWMTTEMAVRKYIADRGKTSSSGDYGAFAYLKNALSAPESLSLVYTITLRVAIGALVVFVAFLLYVFAAVVDRTLESRAVEQMELTYELQRE